MEKAILALIVHIDEYVFGNHRLCVIHPIVDERLRCKQDLIGTHSLRQRINHFLPARCPTEALPQIPCFLSQYAS